MFKGAIITASDTGFDGKREDVSGQEVKDILLSHGYKVVSYKLLPDDRKMLSEEMKRLCDEKIADLVVTTGGTGFSQRDVTPEATMDIAEKNAFGISEAIRANSMNITKRAMLSRGVSVIRKNTLIINLPGSPKAVRESLEYIIGEIGHGIEVLKGSARECAR